MNLSTNATGLKEIALASEASYVFLYYTLNFFSFLNHSGMEDLKGLEEFQTELRKIELTQDGTDGDVLLVRDPEGYAMQSLLHFREQKSKTDGQP